MCKETLNSWIKTVFKVSGTSVCGCVVTKLGGMAKNEKEKCDEPPPPVFKLYKQHSEYQHSKASLQSDGPLCCQ